MTVFFQHVGERGGTRDFPRTIGTAENGLCRFEFGDIAPYLENLRPSERADLERRLVAEAPDGFQIWGIPSGAKSVLRSLRVGDYLLLLLAVGPGGSFHYVGRIVARPSIECFDLSMHLWGEQRFPLIVFMTGALTNYAWTTFCEQFGYAPHWNPAGNTFRLVEERISHSAYGTEERVIVAVGGSSIVPGNEDSRPDMTLLDDCELDIADEEGRQALREHLVRERSARLIAAFKRQLKDFACSACGFRFEDVYGELGRAYIEAHHTIPVASLKPGDVVHISDLASVCSNCHRMLHRRHPALTIEELREGLAAAFSGRG